MKNIVLLGSTGSIGTQTLDVVRSYKEDLHVVALAAGNSVEKMEQQIREFSPSYAVMWSEEAAKDLKQRVSDLQVQVLTGMDGLLAISVLPEADVVLTAIVGMIGIRPTIAAIEAGKDIALANKETLVTAGHIIMPLAKEYGVSILPVDSEHSAIFQCLNGEKKSQIETLFLTASGGPFRHGTKEELEKVTVEQALMHPNWSMGAKITIDSATMINKGLEMIEAKWLFDVDIDKIHVLVQPKSVIHSMVGFVDGAVMAQLGTPDMRLPIQYALYYPERNYLGGERLNFEALANIQFEKPNTDVLRGIPIAVEASRIGGSMLTAMNAANEYAVARFLKKDIAFFQIYDMIEYAMSKHRVIKHPDLSQILETERETYERLNKDWRNVSR